MNKKWVLVTGASKGIGKSIAMRLAKDGFSIFVHYNSNRESAELILKQIQDAGGDGQIVGFNVSDSAQIEQELDKIFKDFDGQLYGLVNNAGIHVDTMTGLMSDHDFDKVIQTNLYGPFYLMRYAIKKMMRKRDGVIVNMASLAGQVGNPGQINYAASKAGLIAMTKTLAMEIAKRNVRVNAVSPGLIETSMVSEIQGLEQMVQRIPMQRMGQPEEVAGVVSFLLSKDATYITGHTISVNGGLFPS